MIRFTKSGFEKLKIDLESLMKERPVAVLDLKKAREMGDLSENGYYKAARSKLSSIDHNLRKLSYQIKNASVITNVNKKYVGIGSTVTLEKNGEKVTYQITGDLEANPSEKKISLLSPIGRALENKQVGSEVKIVTPKEKIYFKLIEIS